MTSRQQSAVFIVYHGGLYLQTLFHHYQSIFLHEERYDRTTGKIQEVRIYEDRSTALYSQAVYADSAGFQETMRRVAEIGYKNSTAVAIGQRLLRRLPGKLPTRQDLKFVLTHSDLNRILTDTEQLIRDHETMGCKYIGIGSMPEKYRNPDWIKRFCSRF